MSIFDLFCNILTQNTVSFLLNEISKNQKENAATGTKAL